MKCKKITISILLFIVLQTSDLQAFIGETLFFTSIIACSFFTQLSQQSSLDSLVFKNIKNYQKQREIQQNLLNQSLSDQRRTAYEILYRTSEQAYINTLVQSVSQLRVTGLYHNNTQIIRAAEERANQAHAQVYEHARQERARNIFQIPDTQSALHRTTEERQEPFELPNPLYLGFHPMHPLYRSSLNNFEHQVQTQNETPYKYSNESCRDDIRRKPLPRS